MKEECSNCVLLSNLYVRPTEKDIVKEGYVCTAFLESVNRVMYLPGNHGFCEMFIPKGKVTKTEEGAD